MRVFTSSALLLYLYKRRSDIELKDLAKAFLEPPNVLSLRPTTHFKYLTHGSLELHCTEVIFQVTNLSD